MRALTFYVLFSSSWYNLSHNLSSGISCTESTCHIIVEGKEKGQLHSDGVYFVIDKPVEPDEVCFCFVEETDPGYALCECVDVLDTQC